MLLQKEIKRLTLFVFLVILLTGCDTFHKKESDIENEETIKILSMVADSSLKKIFENKIYFGHHSVGNNIMDGIKGLVNSDSSLNIISSDNPFGTMQPGFFHSGIGKNGDPFGKISSFRQIIEKGTVGDTGIAFFKFCYVDFNKNTDIDSLFSFYQNTFDSLEKERPEIKFAHFTVPLKIIKKGPRTFLKKIIKGKDDIKDNYIRNKFNEKLLQAYGDNVFDLARLESTKYDGSRTFIIRRGEKIFYLNPEISSDGGHLNKSGSEYIAEQLILFISKKL